MSTPTPVVRSFSSQFKAVAALNSRAPSTSRTNRSLEQIDEVQLTKEKTIFLRQGRNSFQLVERVNRSVLRRLSDGDHSRLCGVHVAEPVEFLFDQIETNFAVLVGRNGEQTNAGDGLRRRRFVADHVRHIGADHRVERLRAGENGEDVGARAVEHEKNARRRIVGRLIERSSEDLTKFSGKLVVAVRSSVTRRFRFVNERIDDLRQNTGVIVRGECSQAVRRRHRRSFEVKCRCGDKNETK